MLFRSPVYPEFALTFPPGTRGYHIDFYFYGLRMRIESMDGGSPVSPPLGNGLIAENPVAPRVGAIPFNPALQPNDFVLTLRETTLSFGMAWEGNTPRINSAIDPLGANLYGRPLYLTVVARDGGRDSVIRLASVTVRRNPFPTGGGPCADATPPEPYCPR